MDLEARAARLAQLMETRLDLAGDGLSGKLERAGKRLPRHIRAEAMRLVEAQRLQGHPRLSRQLDDKRLKQAFKAVERYLLAVDPWARRWGVAVSWLATNVVNLALLAGVIVALMAWRGFL